MPDFDFDTPDMSLPDMEMGDVSAPELSAPDMTAPNPYDMDPSQWDQETKSYAAFGQLHSMIDDHVNTYGTMPDEQTTDGFTETILDKWGAKTDQNGARVPLLYHHNPQPPTQQANHI